MPLQTATTLVGIAKQSAKGTIATNPAFAHGIKSGSPLTTEAKQSPMDVTAAKRAAYNMVREAVESGASYGMPAYLKSLGLLLLGAIGTDTVTGSSPNYIHTYATGDLPYLTVFAKGPDGVVAAVRDNKVDELTLKWDGSKPVEVSVKTVGTVFSYPATFTPTTDETGSESYLVPIGGTFQIDALGSSPATVKVTGGELTIKNNVESIMPSATIEADNQYEGRQEHSLKLTIVPDDFALFRSVVTGATNGTAATGVAPTGSVSLAFKENNGNGTLAITGSKVAWNTKLPDASPKGGYAKLELAAEALMPAGGTSPLIYVLTNAQASY